MAAAAASHSRRVGNWNVMPHGVGNGIPASSKEGTYKVETRLQGCRRVVPGGWSPPPSSTTEEGVPVPVRAHLRQQHHTACEGTWPSRHARVGCGLPRSSFVRFWFLHGKARRQPASASALAPWALIVKRVPSSGPQPQASLEDPRGRTWAGRLVNHT